MKNGVRKVDNLEAITLILYNQINDAEYDGASRFKALKLLYQLKQELPEDHPLRENIPFYWYRHGPFSDIISQKLDELIGQYLLKVPYGDKFKFRIRPEFEIEEINYDHEIIDQKVIKIIKKLMNRDVFDYIAKIVYKKAPYPFMPLYKLKLWKNIEDYRDSIIKNDENPDLIESAIELGYKCEARLPFESYFSKYEDLFSNFLTSWDRIYQNDMADFYFPNIENNVETVWYTFAYGLRVKKHDKFSIYENQVIKWDIKFQKELINLRSDLKQFRRIARKSSNGNKVEFSDTSKKILSSTLGTYVR